MLRRLVPVILALAGLAAGAGAGLFLRPADPGTAHAGPEEAQHTAPAQGTTPEDHAPGGHGAKEPETGAEDHGAPGHGEAAEDSHGASSAKGGTPAHDYVKLNNQFVVPVVQEGRVAALVILSLSLEVAAGTSERVYQVEPKLRDGFLQVMFDHANAGGFLGTFTDGSNMILLREALAEVAQGVLGADVSDVLIVDIVRQDG